MLLFFFLNFISFLIFTDNTIAKIVLYETVEKGTIYCFFVDLKLQDQDIISGFFIEFGALPQPFQLPFYHIFGIEIFQIKHLDLLRTRLESKGNRKEETKHNSTFIIEDFYNPRKNIDLHIEVEYKETNIVRVYLGSESIFEMDNLYNNIQKGLLYDAFIYSERNKIFPFSQKDVFFDQKLAESVLVNEDKEIVVSVKFARKMYPKNLDIYFFKNLEIEVTFSTDMKEYIYKLDITDIKESLEVAKSFDRVVIATDTKYELHLRIRLSGNNVKIIEVERFVVEGGASYRLKLTKTKTTESKSETENKLETKKNVYLWYFIVFMFFIAIFLIGIFVIFLFRKHKKSSFWKMKTGVKNSLSCK